jgi:serine/threonine protein kinase
MGFAKIYSYG